MKKYGFIIFLISLAFLPLFGCSKKGEESSSGSTKGESRKIEYYTCPMHRFIHEDKPGHCPICGMDLIPVYSEAEVPPAEAGPPAMKPTESQPSVPPGPQAKKEKKILYWTDPMIPGYKSDKPGKSPMGMGLTPVYEEETEGTESTPSKASGMSTVRLSMEKQQLIGVRTEIAEVRPMIREISTAGRVAFNPDLLLAQNEYLIALRSAGGAVQSMQDGLVKAARMRLQILGMTETQIVELGKKNKAQMNLLLPQKGEFAWVYASIYEMDLPWVKVGMPVKAFLPGLSDPQGAVIESIDPMIDPMTRTIQVRFRLPNPQGQIKPEMYVKVLIQAQKGSVLAIPENAVLDTGAHQIAFVDKGDGRFEPRELKLGKRGSGYTEILSGVSQGERVVTDANFFLDSESRLKAAISGMEGK
jgi:membrane fusion protein, copper/silver efflux system